MKNPKITPENIGMLKSVLNHARLVGRLIKDPRIPAYLKVLPFAPFLYFIFPLDVIPDLIPIVGQMDDLGVLLLALQAFVMLVPQGIADEHRDDIAGVKPYNSATAGAKVDPNASTIDGKWKVVDKNR